MVRSCFHTKLGWILTWCRLPAATVHAETDLLIFKVDLMAYCMLSPCHHLIMYKYFIVNTPSQTTRFHRQCGVYMETVCSSPANSSKCAEHWLNTLQLLPSWFVSIKATVCTFCAIFFSRKMKYSPNVLSYCGVVLLKPPVTLTAWEQCRDTGFSSEVLWVNLALRTNQRRPMIFALLVSL